MERHNRKSHLVPQLSTQSLIRSENSSSPSKESSSTSTRTPTSGEIPIAGEEVRSVSQHDSHPIHRVMSADINGSGLRSQSKTSTERPTFPPRTSSTSVIPDASRSDDKESFKATATLPIRPAPPPSGPLPQPPASLRGQASKRQGINGLAFASTQGQQFI